jgi:hypothetical protein
METPHDMGPVKSRYTKLETDRQPYLDRAREYAKLTVPYLMPPEGHNGTADLATPYQSVGANAVNTLAAKTVLSIFPPNMWFAPMSIDDNTEKELAAFAEEQGQDPKAIAQTIRDNLAQAERVALKWTEGTQLRVVMSSLMKHLIAGGNYALQCDMAAKTPVVRGFRLDQYVCRKSPRGELVELIIKEKIDPSLLTEQVKVACDCDKDDDKTESEFVEIYTRIWRVGKKFNVIQELNGIPVPESEGAYPEDRLPYLVLNWEREEGEHYGRGYVEQYAGDLYTAEGLSKSLVEGAAAVAKVLFLVSANGETKKRTISEAPNCAVVQGRADDVTVIQANKMGDFQVAQQHLGEVIRRLGRAFILQDSIQRDAERVTAEEIRMMAEMLDQQLGGVYARMARELQYPLANIILRGLEKSKRIPPIPRNEIKVQIVTGIEALGRGQELQALRGLVTDAANTLGPEGLAMFHQNELLNRMAHGYGVKTDGLVKTAEELQAEQQAAQQAQQQQQAMQMAEKLGPQLMAQQGEQGAAQ